MKDEEMADEYVKKEGFRSGMFGELDNITSSEANKEIKQAFLAGLKAGRPQWHILAEEHDVLPEEGQEVKVLTEEGEIGKSTYFYDTYYEEYAFSNIGLQKVFAWCEIPTFDKE